MYHQFLELADVDITKAPMEVGLTCHYMMGGVKVAADTGESSVPGLFAAGEAAAGLHGANRLGGNSLSDLLVFGRRTGLAAAGHAKKTAMPSLDTARIEEAEREMLAPFEREVAEMLFLAAPCSRTNSASASATSLSAARRFARKASASPTMPSFR
jgi:succinate dehydrogenase / fumarate reductase flavoprotein subunit